MKIVNIEEVNFQGLTISLESSFLVKPKGMGQIDPATFVGIRRCSV